MRKALQGMFAGMMIFSLPVFAVNYGFLSNTAMSYFTKDDWQIFDKAQNQALNRGKNGVKVTWRNLKSGNHGYMVPASAPSQQGMSCRYLSFYNVANLIEGEATYKFCKSTNGIWKIYN